MPRHFLVKRHKQCGATLSYRDRPHGDQGNIISSNDSYITASTTIIDTDKNIIIRDGDHHSDYSGYSSPDSGYAASPNGAHANCTREKENVGGDRQNNNNMNCTKVNNAIGFYDQANVIMNRHQYSSINNNHYYSSNGIHPDVVDESDVPMDLSMPSRKKEVLSSVPAYLQQENHRHHHHHQQQQHAAAQQQQPQKYLFHHPLSPNNISSTPSSHAAAVVYLNTFTNFYLQDKQDKSLCTTMVQPLSPAHPVYNPLLPLPGPDSHTESRYANTLTADVVAMDTTGPAAQAELFPRAPCLSVPTTSNGQISSLSSSSFSSLSSKSLINVSSRDSSTTEGRVTPLKTPSPLHSPSRKRAISEDQEEPINTCLPQNLSKSAPVLKKCDVAHSAVTPTSKGTTATAQQRGKTTVPAVKKSQSATPSGKKLKAVRRLNFDIDTTSPVSGTIIKDAADFHPEEGKIVYGDIEPSFNFVEVTPEARAELEKIENKIGDYICQLCKEFYEDAFQLAQHRCSRIVHVEYRCPECEKVFNCPANLASHRRWHKPRAGASGKAAGSGLSKLLPATQKIVPKPDCNGNNVTDAFPATKGSNASSASAVTIVSLPSNVSNPSKSLAKYADDISSSSVQPGADFTGANKDFSTVTKSMIHQSDKINNANIAFREDSEPGVSHSKPVSNTDDKLPAVSVNASRISNGGIYQDPVLSQRSKSVSPSSDSSFPPSTYQESHLRPGSVIATNPLHTTTFGSTLTPEEKSLVLQVLNSHQRHHQTTTITCTTTVMTPLVSDSHSSILNSDPMNTSCNDIPKPSEGGDLTRPGLVEDRVTVMDTSSSSPPLDLTQTSEASYQREQFDQRQYEGRLSTEPQPQQQQQQHHPMAAVPERQGNPQIQCLLCGKRFQRQAYLRKHMQSQHGKHKTVLKPTDVIACKDLNTPDGNGILSGATTTTTTFSTDHHGGFTTTMSCGVCGKCFNSESARLKHEATTHGLPPTLTCSTCAMTFTSKAALDKHTRANHAAESFPCKYCSSSFHSSPGLTRHINKCHPTENRQVILLQLPASRTC